MNIPPTTRDEMTITNGTTTAAEQAAKQNAHSFLTEIPPEIEPGRRLLEKYSGFAPEDVDAHILNIRDKAWAVFPYGCIGSFAFLNLTPTIQEDDARYQTVAARLKAPGSTETFLDVGCCLGSLVRQLISDGVCRSDRLYGTDLQQRFLDLGYELFRDNDASNKATFVAGDMLDENDERLDVLTGKIDIIHAAAFFHLFEREGQVKAARRMVRFLRPGNPNAMIFGQDGGPKVEGWEKYVLDAESWRSMWEEAGGATGMSFRTETDVSSSDDWIRVQFAVY
ncbi:S-adenosyl-L-methionine-dependent methyltransferase, partial [Apodospora peruviana]